MLRTPERPITSFEDDEFGLKPFIDQISNTLVYQSGNHWASTGRCVGLTGQWGTGKSSILNLLSENIAKKCSNNVVIVRFNPWLVTNRDQLIHEFLNELRASYADWLSAHCQFPEINPWVSRALARKLDEGLADYSRYYASLANAVADTFLPGLGNMVREISLRAFETVPITLAQQKKHIESCIDEINLPVVVLVDEMDRVEDAEIRTMAQVVKAIADIPNVSFLLAFDKLRIIQALSFGEFARGEEYLEKIVGYTIEVPGILDGREKTYLYDFALETCVDQKIELNQERQQFLFDAIPSALLSARDLKRIASAFEARLRMVDGEVDPTDVLAWCILEAKAMSATEKLKEHYKHFVCDDHSPQDLSDEIREVLDDQILQADILSTKLKQHVGITTSWVIDIVIFLFNHQYFDSKYYEDPTRIAYKQPFLTLTRGGLAPTPFTKSYLERIIANTSDIKSELERLQLNNQFSDLFECFKRYYPMGEKARNHETFFHELILFLETNVPESRSWEEIDRYLSVTKSLGELIAERPHKTYEYVAMVGKVVEKLLAKDCIIVAASIAHRMPYPHDADDFADDNKNPLAIIRQIKSETATTVEKLYSEAERLSYVHSFAPLYFLNSLDGKYDRLMLEVGDKIIRDQGAHESFIFEAFRPPHALDNDYLVKLFPLKDILSQVESAILNADNNGRNSGPLYTAMKRARKRIQQSLAQ